MMDIVEELRRDRESGAKRLVCEYKGGLMSIARRFFANESAAGELGNAPFSQGGGTAHRAGFVSAYKPFRPAFAASP